MGSGMGTDEKEVGREPCAPDTRFQRSAGSGDLKVHI